MSVAKVIKFTGAIVAVIVFSVVVGLFVGFAGVYGGTWLFAHYDFPGDSKYLQELQDKGTERRRTERRMKEAAELRNKKQ